MFLSGYQQSGKYCSDKMMKYIFLCAFVAVMVSGAEFSKYFKPCKLSDPSINQCLIDQANAAWQVLLHGDEYSNKNLSATVFNFPDRSVNATNDFQFNYTDAKGYNFDKFNITFADYYKTLNIAVYILFAPEVFGTAKYEMKLHQFMGEDIHGKGQVNITVVNCKCIVEVYLTTTIKDGVEFFSIKKSKFGFIPEKVVLSFSGLFDGDDEKEHHANKHINTHWMEFWKNTRISNYRPMNDMAKTIFNTFLSKIPKNELLLP